MRVSYYAAIKIRTRGSRDTCSELRPIALEKFTGFSHQVRKYIRKRCLSYQAQSLHERIRGAIDANEVASKPPHIVNGPVDSSLCCVSLRVAERRPYRWPLTRRRLLPSCDIGDVGPQANYGFVNLVADEWLARERDSLSVVPFSAHPDCSKNRAYREEKV